MYFLGLNKETEIFASQFFHPFFEFRLYQGLVWPEIYSFFSKKRMSLSLMLRGIKLTFLLGVCCCQTFDIFPLNKTHDWQSTSPIILCLLISHSLIHCWRHATHKHIHSQRGTDRMDSIRANASPIAATSLSCEKSRRSHSSINVRLWALSFSLSLTPSCRFIPHDKQQRARLGRRERERRRLNFLPLVSSPITHKTLPFRLINYRPPTQSKQVGERGGPQNCSRLEQIHVHLQSHT